MIASFFVTILTLLTLTMSIFTAMSNVAEVEAATNVNANCGIIDQNPNAECDVGVDYDGSCSPSDNNCNVNVNVLTTPQPTGANQLFLNYLLETGIECGSVKSSWGKAACLAASQNEYTSSVTTNTAPGTTNNNQFNFEGSQQVRETSGQDNFAATNTMTQTVKSTTLDAGAPNPGIL